MFAEVLLWSVLCWPLQYSDDVVAVADLEGAKLAAAPFGRPTNAVTVRLISEKDDTMSQG